MERPPRFLRNRNLCAMLFKLCLACRYFCRIQGTGNLARIRYMLIELRRVRGSGAERLLGAEEVEMGSLSRTAMWRASPIAPDLLLGAALVCLDVFARVAPHGWH